ncbi:neprilysin-11 [Orussus abietinus]|uniref:neprilysin-11 n=1 Tax=Orussus abietinus TaxID=222816 RepID=UPI0006263D83|nr:neprilysin-11 [Orussus abietinus]
MCSIFRISFTIWSGLYFQLVSLGFFIIANVAIAEPGPGFSRPRDVCTNPACRAAADEFLKNMNPAVSPCTDFFDYACGNFKNHHPLDPKEGTIDYSMKIKTQINNRLREIAESPVKNTDSSSLKKAKLAYKVCTNEEDLEEEGIRPIALEINKQGGWPMAMNNWTPGSRSWIDIEMSYISMLGESAFFRVTVDPDSTIDTINTLMLSPCTSMLPFYVRKHQEHHKDKIKLYRDFIIEVVKEFVMFITLPPYKISEEAQQIIDLEIALTNIKTLSKANEIVETTPAHFQDEYDKIRHVTPNSKIIWADMLKSIFSQTNFNFAPTTIKLQNKGYFVQLAKLLDKTPTRVLVNFIHWQYVRRLIKNSGESMRRRYNDVREELLYGKAQKWWQDCLDTNPAIIAFIHQYLKNHASKKSLETVGTMVDHHKSQLESQIEHTLWLDYSTRLALMKKAKSVTKFLGYPPWYKSSSVIDEYYALLEVTNNHFQNLLNFKKFTIYQTKRLLLAPVGQFPEHSIWSQSVLEETAYFISAFNSLIIPSGALHFPFFHGEDVPENVLYGSTGNIIGHELSHGFDDEGRQYTFNGSSLEWPPDTLQEYNARVKCFVKQFNQYPYKELNEIGRKIYADGKLTASENMADTTGMYIAFAAFRDRARKRNKDYKKLPGLENLTDNQLFFLSFANTWCSYTQPEKLLFMLLLKLPHSISRHRVIGTLSNIADFAKAFNCPHNSAMNPRDKCYLWK